MNNFRVNEVASLRALAHAPELNGQDCTILLPEAMRDFINPKTGEVGQGMRYIIVTASGKRGAVCEGNLVKKHPKDPAELRGQQAALQCIFKAMRPAKVRA